LSWSTGKREEAKGGKERHCRLPSIGLMQPKGLSIVCRQSTFHKMHSSFQLLPSSIACPPPVCPSRFHFFKNQQPSPNPFHSRNAIKKSNLEMAIRRAAQFHSKRTSQSSSHFRKMSVSLHLHLHYCIAPLCSKNVMMSLLPSNAKSESIRLLPKALCPFVECLHGGTAAVGGGRLCSW